MIEIFGVPYLKKGSGIHIKKKNRGKFTEYCGGEVTDKCILKAKKSKNPKLRKRATFAENARAWKHQQGGTIPRYLGIYLNSDPYLDYWFANRRLNPKYKEQLKDIDTLLKRSGNYQAFDNIEDYTKAETVHDLGYFFLDEYEYKLNENIDNRIIPRIGFTDYDRNLIYYPKNNRTVLLHENTHALKAEPQQEKILEKVGSWSGPYEEKPDEIYPNLMELRNYYNLDPTKLYSKELLYKLIEDGKKSGKTFNILDRYNIDLIDHLINEVALNDMLKDDRNYFAKLGVKLIPKKQNAGKLDIKGLMNDPEFKKNHNLYINPKNIAIANDSLIGRKANNAQIGAVLTQIISESGGETKPHGNGAVGLIGWRGERAKGLPTTLSGQLHHLMKGLFESHKDWSDGGSGMNIGTGKEMQLFFKDGAYNNYRKATNAVMNGYVRPPEDLKAKRHALVQIVKKYIK